MANEEHLRILREGVDRWNQWRKDNSDVKPDLSGADISKLCLSTESSQPDFIETNLSNANLSKAMLDNANLSKATLISVNGIGAFLRGANLNEANLSSSDFSEADFMRANLRKANLSNAYLGDVDFSKADLSEANLHRAILNEADFYSANLSLTDLRNADILSVNLGRANLSNAIANRADFSSSELGEADLSGADLSLTNFNATDLYLANLSEANLSGASLCEAKALRTNFSQAVLTGACIEDWHINNTTQLDSVICEYVYLKYWQNERRPSDCNKIFAPGDFARLAQKSLKTVDLIFRNGIDWKAFFQSFGDLQIEYGDRPISIQAIENKNDGAFVIRLNVPPDLDKAVIERQAMEQYKTKRLELEAWYRSTLQLKDEQIADLRQHSKDLMELAKLRANQPIQNYINSTIIYQHGKGDNFGGDRIQGNKVIGDRDETSER